jgi:hypothetical protein
MLRYTYIACLVCPVICFRQSCRLRSKVEKTVQTDRPQMTVRRMRIASWITKAAHTRARIYTHTHRICSSCFFYGNRFLERASLLRYACIIACLVYFNVFPTDCASSGIASCGPVRLAALSPTGHSQV